MVGSAGYIWSIYWISINALKTYLIVKQDHEELTRETYSDTNKVQGWTKEIINLVDVVSS